MNPVYRWPGLYHALLRLRLGRAYQERYREIADLVEPGESVLELCCGDARLYRGWLRGRAASYKGIDLDETFTCGARAEGIDIDVADVESVPWPAAEVVLMQAALYHFLPDRADAVVARMRRTARRVAIVAEPVENLSGSRFPPAAWLGRRLSRTALGDHPRRFDAASFSELARRHGATACRVGPAQAVACFPAAA